MAVFDYAPLLATPDEKTVAETVKLLASKGVSYQPSAGKEQVLVGQLSVKSGGARPLRAIMSAQGRTATENWVQNTIMFILEPVGSAGAS